MLKTVQNIDLKISGLKLLSKIGEGGMSVVYLAEQISLKRKVAVKVMRLEVANNELDVQRFKHEAKTIASLDHPNIINIYNIGLTVNGEIFYTMPYLNHGDFSSYIIKDEQEFIILLQSICDGLSFAHDRGVIHRDIKPENLLFDKFGNIRIADFGIAISQDSSRMTKEHQVVGSAHYMSPEQARSLKVDRPSDVYSLGIVIYERLTGRVPFDSDENISVLVDHVSMEPPKLQPKMRHWQKLIDKCLAKFPDDRYQSMIELKIALSKIPTSSLQRTNSSILNIFSDHRGKHLMWFLPSLLVLLVVALIGFNKNQENVDNRQPIIGVESQSQKKENHLLVPQVKTVNTQQKDSNDLNQESLITSISLESQKNILNDEMSQEQLNDESPSLVDQDIESLLSLAFENIKIYQLSKPADNNATDQLLKVLSMSPENIEAIKGLESIGNKYVQLIENALAANELDVALTYSRSLESFNQKSDYTNKEFETHKKSLIDRIKELNLVESMDSSDQTMALRGIIKIFASNDVLLEKLAYYESLREGPQIGDKLLDRLGIETILLSKKLAVTLTEITIKNYSVFANATDRIANKCKHKGGGSNIFFGSKYWNKPFFPQDPNHPVVCVTQADAVAYSEWLSGETDNNYRLPTSQEWMILSSKFSNSFKPCRTANVAGKEAEKIRNKEEKYICTDSYIFTAPVATYSVNKDGLFDIQGNVSEWVACDDKSCQNPIAMGSSWFNGKDSNKLDQSESLLPDTSYSYVGFRLVRDI